MDTGTLRQFGPIAHDAGDLQLGLGGVRSVRNALQVAGAAMPSHAPEGVQGRVVREAGAVVEIVWVGGTEGEKYCRPNKLSQLKVVRTGDWMMEWESRRTAPRHHSKT